MSYFFSTKTCSRYFEFFIFFCFWGTVLCIDFGGLFKCMLTMFARINLKNSMEWQETHRYKLFQSLKVVYKEFHLKKCNFLWNFFNNKVGWTFNLDITVHLCLLKANKWNKLITISNKVTDTDHNKLVVVDNRKQFGMEKSCYLISILINLIVIKSFPQIKLLYRLSINLN